MARSDAIYHHIRYVDLLAACCLPSCPLLWALHKVHHCNRDIDVTTGFKFHPAEIAISLSYKLALVALLGVLILAIIIFEIILNACAIFNHSNAKLPLALDKLLRRFIVTPDMHRVHHSTIMPETNSNYSFNISLWDKLFGSYTAQPSKGHDGMVIGLEEYQSNGPTSLIWSLWLPVKAKKTLTWSRLKVIQSGRHVCFMVVLII